jgi:hypothetical protein
MNQECARNGCLCKLKKLTKTRDWNGRRFHLKCHRIVMERYSCIQMAIDNAETKAQVKMFEGLKRGLLK